MNIRSVATLRHPPVVAAMAYREQLPDIAASIPGVRSVTRVRRWVVGDSVQMHHVWTSARDVPRAWQRLVRPEQLCLDDYAIWAPDGLGCRWVIKSRVFPGAMDCRGTMSFTEIAGGTRVILEGSFRFDPHALTGIPRVMARRLLSGAEGFLPSLVQPNLDEVNEALRTFLNQQEDGC